MVRSGIRSRTGHRIAMVAQCLRPITFQTPIGSIGACPGIRGIRRVLTCSTATDFKFSTTATRTAEIAIAIWNATWSAIHRIHNLCRPPGSA